MEPGFYNMDCMQAMPQFPDKFFDLAIVDPPYGDGNSKIGGGCDSGSCSIGIKNKPNRTGNSWSKKYGKKLLRGMLPQSKLILKNCSASHAIKLYGAGTILTYRQQGVFLSGVS